MKNQIAAEAEQEMRELVHHLSFTTTSEWHDARKSIIKSAIEKAYQEGYRTAARRQQHEDDAAHTSEPRPCANCGYKSCLDLSAPVVAHASEQHPVAKEIERVRRLFRRRSKSHASEHSEACQSGFPDYDCPICGSALMAKLPHASEQGAYTKRLFAALVEIHDHVKGNGERSPSLWCVEEMCDAALSQRPTMDVDEISIVEGPVP